MADPRTIAYLRELAKAHEQNRKVVDAAEQICTCIDCVEARAKKQISPCEQSKMMQTIRDSVIPSAPSNYFPELSPNWNPNSGMLESDSRPVGLYGTESNSGRIANKWMIKDD